VKSLLLLACISATVSAIPLDSVFARADRATHVSWVASAANTDPWFYVTYGSKCTGTDSIYRHSDFLAGKSYRSIAYSYGGEDAPELFASRIAKGDPAGSHLCHYKTFGDPTPKITGTDCTGFLFYAWDSPRQSSASLAVDSRYPVVARNSVKAGDALVKGGSHAALILNATNPAKTLIVESAGTGIKQRYIDINSSYWSGFMIKRNLAIGNSTPLASETAVRQAPFTLTRTADHLLLSANYSGPAILCSVQGKILAELLFHNGTCSLPFEPTAPLILRIEHLRQAIMVPVGK